MAEDGDSRAWLLANSESAAAADHPDPIHDPHPSKAEPVTCCEWMRTKAKALKKESTAIFYALQDTRTPWYSKILPFLALSYYLCPLDLIPDFIPILGSMDDMIIVPSLLWLSLLLIPKDVMADARKRAKQDPLRMSKNWGAAVVVFIIWMCALETSLFMVSHTFFWHVQAVRTWLPFVMIMVLAVASAVFTTWAVSQMRSEAAQAEDEATAQDTIMAGAAEAEAAV